MKRLFLILLTIVFLLSCSSDDEVPKDSIVGYWKPVGISLLLNDGTAKEVALTECELHTYMSMQKEGGFHLQIHTYDEDNESCYSHISSYNANWNKVSENQYSVEMKFYYITYKLPEPGEYYDEGEITFTLNVSFPEEKVMHIHDQELLGFFPEEIYGEDVASFYVIYENRSF